MIAIVIISGASAITSSMSEGIIPVTAVINSVIGVKLTAALTDATSPTSDTVVMASLAFALAKIPATFSFTLSKKDIVSIFAEQVYKNILCLRREIIYKNPLLIRDAHSMIFFGTNCKINLRVSFLMFCTLHTLLDCLWLYRCGRIIYTIVIGFIYCSKRKETRFCCGFDAERRLELVF